MDHLKSRSFRLSCLALFLIGLAAGIWQGVSRKSPVMTFLSDLFFSEFMVFLIFGVFRVLGNMHAFTAATYSFRFIHRIFRNQKVSGKNSRDEYLQYRSSKAEHPEAVWYLIAAAVFLLLSVAVILLSNVL